MGSGRDRRGLSAWDCGSRTLYDEPTASSHLLYVARCPRVNGWASIKKVDERFACAILSFVLAGSAGQLCLGAFRSSTPSSNVHQCLICHAHDNHSVLWSSGSMDH